MAEEFCESYIEDASGGKIKSPIPAAKRKRQKPKKDKESAKVAPKPVRVIQLKTSRRDYPDEALERVISLIKLGYSIKAISGMDGMPTRDYLWQKVARDPVFADIYAQAIELRADRYFEEMLEIADECEHDIEVVDSKYGPVERTNRRVVERARLMIDARKWVLSKMLPRKYGDRTEIEHSGKLDIPALSVVIEA